MVFGFLSVENGNLMKKFELYVFFSRQRGERGERQWRVRGERERKIKKETDRLEVSKKEIK
jgi:hypothetical protein